MKVQCDSCSKRSKGGQYKVKPNGWRLECEGCTSIGGATDKSIKKCLRCDTKMVIMGVSSGTSVICKECLSQDTTAQEAERLHAENVKLANKIQINQWNATKAITKEIEKAVKAHQAATEDRVLLETAVRNLSDKLQVVTKRADKNAEKSLTDRLRMKMHARYNTHQDTLVEFLAWYRDYEDSAVGRSECLVVKDFLGSRS